MTSVKIWDDIGDIDKDQVSYTTRCTSCGARNLGWEDDNGKWVLVSKNGEIHHCPAKEPMDLQTLIKNGF